MTTEGKVVQGMWEQESARIWEEMSKPIYDGETMRQAERSMRWCVEEMDKACDSANEAAELLVDTPLGDRVSSILHDMEDILCEIKRMQKAFAKEAS